MRTAENKPVVIGPQKWSETRSEKVLKPLTRKQATQAKRDDPDVQIHIPDHLGRALVLFHSDIGADGKLPSDRRERVDYINRLHLVMIVDNSKCPLEVDFGIIYSRFTNAVMTGSVELRGYSIKPICDAFNQWITSQSVRNALFEAHYSQYPEDRPKQIGSTTSPSTGLDTREYVDQSPEEVQAQINTLDQIYENFGAYLESLDSDKSYFRRLKRTHEMYKEQGRYPE